MGRDFYVYERIGKNDDQQYADYMISIRADEGLLRKRLIDRSIKTGVPEEAAVRFVDFSDMQNVRICLGKRKPANLELVIGDRKPISRRNRRISLLDSLPVILICVVKCFEMTRRIWWLIAAEGEAAS